MSEDNKTTCFTTSIDGESTSVESTSPVDGDSTKSSPGEVWIEMAIWLLGTGLLAFGCGMIYAPLPYIVWGCSFLSLLIIGKNK